jgi:hypothetical protein
LGDFFTANVFRYFSPKNVLGDILGAFFRKLIRSPWPECTKLKTAFGRQLEIGGFEMP